MLKLITIPQNVPLYALDFYLKGYFKCLVYETKVPWDMDFTIRMVEGVVRVRRLLANLNEFGIACVADVELPSQLMGYVLSSCNE